MKILISGSSGLIGNALQPLLKSAGHEIFPLVRSPSNQKNAILWNPEEGKIDATAIEGMDAVINLAGENLAAKRWSAEQKRHIFNSRVLGTKTLSQALTKLKHKPSIFISTSAIGFYGDQAEQVCSEHQPVGKGFLADVCRHWESSAELAAAAGIRTVVPRLGIVLAPRGGALGKMLLPFRCGVGGKLGSGHQYMSWITIDDVTAIMKFFLYHESIEGPVNVVAPNPVTNAEFTKKLGEVLQRPTFLSVPVFALRAILGKEMADELLLSSIRVEPKRLLALGYDFLYPNLDEAFKHLLI